QSKNTYTPNLPKPPTNHTVTQPKPIHPTSNIKTFNQNRGLLLTPLTASINRSPPLPKKTTPPYLSTADRKARGLCFQCDEKYTPGQRCRKQLYQIVLQPLEEEVVEEPENMEIDNENMEECMAQLSIHAMEGLLSSIDYHTMRLIDFYK